MENKAIILGASGLIGSQLLPLLLNGNHFDEVVAFVRKPLRIEHPKLREVITNFDDLEGLNSKIKGSQVFCCLGSTKKKTPNLGDYKRVDLEIPLFFAQKALENGANTYHLVSALGADSSSSNFYTKLKGEVENSIKSLSYPCVHIYQPSFLVGEREENRPLEKIVLPIMRVTDKLLFGSFKKYRSIKAEYVAKAMLNEAIKNKRGIFVHQSDQINKLA